VELAINQRCYIAQNRQKMKKKSGRCGKRGTIPFLKYTHILWTVVMPCLQERKGEGEKTAPFRLVYTIGDMRIFMQKEHRRAIQKKHCISAA
jgi:hypothetical protein